MPVINDTVFDVSDPDGSNMVILANEGRPVLLINDPCQDADSPAVFYITAGNARKLIEALKAFAQ